LLVGVVFSFCRNDACSWGRRAEVVIRLWLQAYVQRMQRRSAAPEGFSVGCLRVV
jgi:hypothetical protein